MKNDNDDDSDDDGFAIKKETMRSPISTKSPTQQIKTSK